MEQKFTLKGHTFDDEKEYIKAGKEAEAIEYLRAKTDFQNLNQVLKLYDRILDRDMMETIIGIEFLREIRTKLVESGMFKDEQIRPVPELPETRKRKRRIEERKKSRERTLLEQVKRQNVILRILCFFLAFLVVAMFVITLTGKRSPLALRYEEQILNKYASWAEDLSDKEEALRAYIRKLEDMGYDLPATLEEKEKTP